ncbi:MAG: efflux RND transporter periplasmic adaptor subunit, partial [Bacillota bacterium]|nr:efflux RND transporter periplasmic adaptor subunit [Bacillota bacterium]
DEANAELAAAQDDLQTALTSLSSTFERDDFAHTAAREAYNLQYLKVENLIASTASIVNAELNMAEAGKKLSEANIVLDQTKIYAPVAGKVLEIAYAPGDDVQARTSATSGTPDFMTLYDPANVQLVANVNEGDISGLEVGQNLRITVDALYLENQAGTVTDVSIMPKIDNTGIVTYAVTGSLEKPDERIRDGMSVFVLFLKKEKLDVLLVPNKAIFMEDGRQHVHVQMADGVIEKRAVVLGLTNGTQSEVIEGLAAGENVVTGGVDR